MTPTPARCAALVLLLLAPLLAPSALVGQPAAAPAPPPPAAAPSGPSPGLAPDLTIDSPEVPELAPPLGLHEAVRQALAANFTLRLQDLATQIARDAEDIARADYDPALEVVVATGETQSARPTVDANGNIIPASGIRSGDDSARLRLVQRTPYGTTLTGTTRLARNERSRVSAGTLNPAYDSDVGLVVVQPLLKGAGRSVNDAALARARLGTERAHAELAAAVLTVVREVEGAYARLAISREQLGLRTFSLDLRAALLEENRARRDAGVATDLEVLQAEVGVATAARDLALARQAAQEREDELLRLLGRESFEQPLGPVELLPAAPAPLDIDASVARARAHRPEFAAALAALRQQELDVSTARDGRRLQLDLGAQAGYSASDRSASASFNQLAEGDGYAWRVDLALRFPWGFREEKARLRQALASRQREELRLAELEQQTLVAVRQAVRAVATGLENLRLSTLAADLGLREYESEKARYDSGLSTFRRVQEAQADLDQARLTVLQAKVDLRVARAELDRLEATAPARYDFTIAP